MEIKSRFNAEFKILACESYKNGNDSFNDIAKSLGCGCTTLREWYTSYVIHGPTAFNNSNKNSSYDKEFKLSVIESYLSSKYTFQGLTVKYNISSKLARNWIIKYNNGVELKEYKPKGDVYTMKSRKTTFDERLKIVKWIISNDMNYGEAAIKYNITYATVYRWTTGYLQNRFRALVHKKRGPALIDRSSISEIEMLKLELNHERSLRKKRELRSRIFIKSKT